MFLNAMQKHNPKLIDAAFKLHRDKSIGPNTYVIDLDAVRSNSAKMVKEAERVGLNLYLMSKQYGRNPLVSWAAAAAGMDKIVAVDVDEAKKSAADGFKLGHVGHLVQVPEPDLEYILSLDPEVVTVFSIEKARQISRICQNTGRTQDLLIRVFDKNDFFYPGQFGGVEVAELLETYRQIEKLPNVHIAGLTSHPCLLFDYEGKRVKPTPNFETLLKGRDLLQRELGVELEQVNTPSVTTTSTIELLKSKGSTHGEPGSSITGNTPVHAYFEQPEMPAMLYVSEISHMYGDKAYFFGGGIYPRSRMKDVLVGRELGQLYEQQASYLGHPSDNIDYYGSISNESIDVEVGDTVIAAFRAQIFVSRSRVAVVSGIQSGTMELLGIFDQHGNMLNEQGVPLGIEEERKVLADTIAELKRQHI